MQFDPEFALDTMLPLAEAAYDAAKLPAPWKLVATLQPDNFGFVATSGNVTAIAFRGTETHGEWLDDFDGLAVRNAFGSGMVHQGFLDVYRSIHPGILAGLAQTDSHNRLVITGHSLGAALATLCTSDSPLIAGRDSLTYTWAGPRGGWRDYADWFAKQGRWLFRIVNEWDVVPRVPSAVNGYEHVGTEVLIDGGRPALNDDFLKTAHNLELSYRPGVARLLGPLQKAA
jgi:triacylglycerol lipase